MIFEELLQIPYFLLLLYATVMMRLQFYFGEPECRRSYERLPRQLKHFLDSQLITLDVVEQLLSFDLTEVNHQLLL